MSVLQPISYGLVHQVGPGTGGRGFGSYKADNTELIRPYQQESSSPIGRGYPMSVVSGRPTVYDPSVRIQEDPIVMLLKQLLGKKTAVEKAPDAGFRSNEQVYPTSGQAIEMPNRTLGDAPADRGLGGGGNVVVDASTDYGSLNEFKSELGKLSAPSEHYSVKSWLDNLPEILDNVKFEGREIGVQTEFDQADPAVDFLLDQLDALQALYESVVRANEGELKRYRSANEYYAAMAESSGVARYETVLSALNNQGADEIVLLKQDILREFNKLVRDKAGELTMREVIDASTQLALDSRNPYAYPSRGMSGMGKKYRRLRINTSVAKSRKESGEQFYPSERTQKVESGRSMNESIPLRRSGRRS